MPHLHTHPDTTRNKPSWWFGDISVDGRGVSGTVEYVFDEIIETAPESIGVDPGPNPDSPIKEVGAMRQNTSTLTTRQVIALDYLARARHDHEQASVARIRYAILGRRHGLTHQQIGDALGITEAAVRAMLNRHTDLAAVTI